jgi:hypothetical protein
MWPFCVHEHGLLAANQCWCSRLEGTPGTISHFMFGIDGYDADELRAKLTGAGLEPQAPVSTESTRSRPPCSKVVYFIAFVFLTVPFEDGGERAAIPLTLARTAFRHYRRTNPHGRYR